MNLIHDFIVLFPLIVIIVVATVAASLWRDRQRKFWPFHIFLVCALGIASGTWAELLAATETASTFWSCVTGVFVSFIPVFWVLYTRYTIRRGDSGTQTLRLFLFLSIIPLITSILRFTNPYHHLIWRGYHFTRRNGYLQVHIDAYGPWFYVHTIYSYFLFLWGAIALFSAEVVHQRFYFFRAALTLVAAGLPVASSVLYFLKPGPVASQDLSPIFFALSGLLFLVLVTKFNLFNVIPNSRADIVKALGEGLIVIDGDGFIIDMNDSALSHFGFRTSPLNHRFSDLSELRRLGAATLSDFANPDSARVIESMGAPLYCEFFVKEDQENKGARVYIVRTYREERPHLSGPDSARSLLSARELRVCELLMTDRCHKEIASELHISSNTLKTHIRHIYRKLGCSNRKELSAFFPPPHAPCLRVSQNSET